MIVRVITINTFLQIAETEAAKYLNQGDIFLPTGSGWEYVVMYKTCAIPDWSNGEYVITVHVQPKGKGSADYARILHENHYKNR